MSVSPKSALKAIRLADSVLNWSVIAGLVLLLGLGGYAIWDRAQVYGNASGEQYLAYEPTAAGFSSFDDLRATNPDVFGWLEVYGTHINYPLVQGPDDMKYINNNAKGQYSLSGAIFLSADNKQDFSDFNNIIYGHHMDHEAMFGPISDFSDANFFFAHRYGTLFHDGQTYGIEFFAFAQADAYNTKIFRVAENNTTDKQAYLRDLLALAVEDRPDVGVSPDDHIVLLSTCSSASTNGRDILVGKIETQVKPDPFPALTHNWSALDATIAVMPNIMSHGVLWYWSALFVIMAVSAVVLLRARKKRGTS